VLGEDLAPGGLGRALAVGIGGVEEIDPCVERGLGAGAGLLLGHAAGIGQPGAEGDLRDLEIGAAEFAEPHGLSLSVVLSVEKQRAKG
jgi:hypothetical protein